MKLMVFETYHPPAWAAAQHQSCLKFMSLLDLRTVNQDSVRPIDKTRRYPLGTSI
jgi:hypothetical protein